ncbi:MAG: hypothetical protein IPJ77_10210 [Planctomycetes bacterium]|nr:hypothetical protein [Planctomycetota bacterium]
MLLALTGTALCFGLCLVLVGGLRAPRTRILAALGLVPAAGACVAFTSAAFELQLELLARYANGLAALALGFAHAVVFSLAALPRERVWLRGWMLFSGLWAGAFGALWIFDPERHLAFDVLLGVFAVATIASWIALPFATRERGFTQHGALTVPSVRFACPRCGTRVDWGRGVAACTDCGLFLHIAWPAREDAPAKAAPDVERSVRFSCPECGSRGRWNDGLSTCSGCGLRLSLHWNVHRTQR